MTESNQTETAEKPLSPEEVVNLKRLNVVNLADVLQVPAAMRVCGEDSIKQVGEVLMRMVAQKKIDARDGMVLLDRCRMIQESGLDKAMEPIYEFYDSNFTFEELTEINQFLYTPTGRKFLKVATESNKRGKGWKDSWFETISAPAREDIIHRDIPESSGSNPLRDIIFATLCNNPECEEHGEAVRKKQAAQKPAEAKA